MKVNTNKSVVITCLYGIIFLFICCTPAKKVGENKYYLSLSYSGPYEVLVNDLVVMKSTKDGASGAENLNSLLNTDGKQRVKIRVFAPDMETGGKISPRNLKSLKAAIYETGPSDKNTLILSLEFPAHKEPAASFECEWSFDNQLKLNYGSLINSKNLNAIPKETLEKLVLSRFNALRAILNAGDENKFMKIIEKAKGNLFAAESIPADQQKEYNENLIGYLHTLKGIVPEIKNYKLRIMGDGRAVSLENTAHNKGLGVLSCEDKKDGSLNKNDIILHLPKDADQFEVLRYNFRYTSLN